jgi:hypothetical protein
LQGHDVPCLRRFELDPLDALEAVEIGDAALLSRLVFHQPGLAQGQQGDGLPHGQPSPLDQPDRQAPQVGRVVDRGYEHLERALSVTPRLGHVCENGVEQGAEIRPRDPRARGRHAVPGRGVDERRIQLPMRRLQIHEQFQHLVVDLFGTGIRPVYLVDDHHRLEVQLQCLACHEPGLWHGPFRRVHQDEHAVHHAEDAFNLAAEIGVPRRVDEIDLGIAPTHRGILGQDRDAPLPLEGIRVHHALAHVLIVSENSRLAEHLVDQRGLAVIDVRDNRDVTK